LSNYSVIVLSQNDFIVDSESVRHWLASHPESNEYKGNKTPNSEKKVHTVWTDKTIDHGHILVD